MSLRGSNVQGETQSGTPAGTPEELRKAGLSPGNIASCAPCADSPDAKAGVRGCPCSERCRFDQTINGGFKYVGGPRNIGFSLETHEGNVVEGEASCFFFTQTLQDRMDHGNAQRLQGKVGERIAIIAQEGEKIIKQYEVNRNYLTGKPPDWHVDEFEVEVSRFLRPGEQRKLNYNQRMRKRQAERDKLNPALATGPPERIVAGRGAAMKPFVDDAPATAEPIATAEPEPVKAKR